MKTLLLLVLSLSVSTFAGTAVAQLQATLLQGSRLVIEGRSTVNRFECEVGSFDGTGSFEAGRADARLAVRVEAFDCGKMRMNHDFREALEGDEHPEIRFELSDALRVGLYDGSERLAVEGQLTIAGVTRHIELNVRAERLDDGTYRVRGSDELRMTDFGIDPPTALAGLIRTHDRIVVHFNLVASTIEHGSGPLPEARADLP